MNEPARHLPSGLFVLLAAALTLAGGGWWAHSAPATAATVSASPSAPMSSVVKVRLDNGKVLTYDSGRSTISAESPAFTSLTGLMCRRPYRNVRSVERGSDSRLPRCGVRAARPESGWGVVSYGGRSALD